LGAPEALPHLVGFPPVVVFIELHAMKKSHFCG
jgi:hypothetical protein